MDLYHQLPSDLQRYVRLHRHAMDTRAACVIQRHFRNRMCFDLVHKWPDKCYTQIHQSCSKIMEYICAETDGMRPITCLVRLSRYKMRSSLLRAMNKLRLDHGYLSICVPDGSQIFVISEGLLSEDVATPGWHFRE